MGQDGSFHILDVPPAKFKAVVEPMPENGYLQVVSLDGNLDSKIAPDPVLDFSQGVGSSRLKITVSRNGGQISGRVLDKDGAPAAGLMMVYFGTDAKQLESKAPAKVSDGKYSFKGVCPGKYHILAVDVAEVLQAFGDDGNNEETMKQLFDAAEEIEVKEGDRISKDITALTRMPDKKEER